MQCGAHALTASRSGCSALSKMAAREVSFEEQRNVLRALVATRLEDAEDWEEAAKVCLPGAWARLMPCAAANTMPTMVGI